MALDDEIYQYMVGNDDNGSAINFNAETHEKNFGANFEDIIVPVQIEVNIALGNNVGVWGALDNGLFKRIGVVKRGINRLTLDVDPATGDFPRCQTVRLAFREMSKSKLAIATCAIHYYVTAEEEEYRP